MSTIEITCKTCGDAFSIETKEDFFAFNCKKCRTIYAYIKNKTSDNVRLIRKGIEIPEELFWAKELLCLEYNYPSEDIIKLARKKQIELYHPDKVSHLGKEIQDLANNKTQQINQAYDALHEWIMHYNDYSDEDTQVNNNYNKSDKTKSKDNQKENEDLYFWVCSKCNTHNGWSRSKCKKCGGWRS